MSAPFIDAHCHLSDRRVFEAAGEQIKRALDADVSQMMIGGVNPPEWENQKKLSALFPKNLKLSFGIHPWEIEKHSDPELHSQFEKLSAQLVHAHALGETGLDFHPKRDASRFPDQEKWFQLQLELAVRVKKPLVLHVVHAQAKALQMVKEAGANAVPILVHSFSGSIEDAKEWIKCGALLSFSGSILVQGKYEKVKKALIACPINHLLLETDSPDQIWRENGQNEPSFVKEVYQGAALLRGMDLNELREKVAENFKTLG